MSIAHNVFDGASLLELLHRFQRGDRAQAPAIPERPVATGGIVNPDITGYH